MHGVFMARAVVQGRSQGSEAGGYSQPRGWGMTAKRVANAAAKRHLAEIEFEAAVREMHEEGHPLRRIAFNAGISHSTIYNIINRPTKASTK